MATRRKKYNHWTLWVAVLSAIVLLLMLVFGCGGKVCCTSGSTTADATVESVEATFNAGRVNLMGAVSNQSDRDTLIRLLGDRYGVDNLTAQLAVDTELDTDNQQVLTLNGAVESRDTATQIAADLQAALPHYRVDDRLTVIAAPVSDAAKVVCGDTLALAIRFDTGSAALQQNDRALLDAAAPCITQPYEIQGHTDSQGELDMNMELSQQRADAVQVYLIEKDVASDLLTTRAFGPNQPIASNQSDHGRSMNRRIELRAQPQQ